MKRVASAFNPRPPTPGRLARVGAAVFFAYLVVMLGVDAAARLAGGPLFTPPAGDGATTAEHILMFALVCGLTVLSGAVIGLILGAVPVLLRWVEAQLLRRV